MDAHGSFVCTYTALKRTAHLPFVSVYMCARSAATIHRWLLPTVDKDVECDRTDNNITVFGGAFLAKSSSSTTKSDSDSNSTN